MPAMMPFAALTLATNLLTVAADKVPTLKVEPSCKAAGVEGVITGRTAESCLNDEHSARDELNKNWSSFSSDDKNHCLSMVSTGGSPSYVELLSCLEMSRDAKKIAEGRKPDEQPTKPATATRRKR